MTETSWWPKKTRATERARADGAREALVGIVGQDRAAELCDLFELLHGGLDPPPTEAEARRGELSAERADRLRKRGLWVEGPDGQPKWLRGPGDSAS